MRKKLMGALMVSLLGLSFSFSMFSKPVEAAQYTSEVGVEFYGHMPDKEKPTTPTATSPTTSESSTVAPIKATPNGKTAKGQTILPQTGEKKESGLSMMGLLLLLAIGLGSLFKQSYSKRLNG